VPANLPAGWSDPASVGPTLVEEDPRVFNAPAGPYLRRFRPFFSPNIAFLTPAKKALAESLLSSIRPTLVLLVVLILLYAFRGYIFGWMDPDPVIPFPMVLVTILVVGAVVGVVATGLLPPRHTPYMRALHESQGAEAVGDPMSAFASLEEAGRLVGDVAGRGRYLRRLPYLRPGPVGDAAVFRGELVVETAPVQVRASDLDPAQFLLLIGGALLLVGGLLGLTFMSVDQGLTDEAFLKESLPKAVLLFLGLFAAASLGRFLLSCANILFNTFRFQSYIYVAALTGTASRTEIAVGRGVHDSIESRNVVMRSDMRVEYAAADVISEATPLDGRRAIVSFRDEPRLRDGLEYFREALSLFGEKGVRVRGIELGDKVAAGVMNANIELAARREAARQQAIGSAHQAQLSNARAAQLHGGTPDGVTLPPLPEPAADRFCTNCGAPRKPNARFCGTCGSDFS
jgi:hypothetical protein